MEIRGSGIRGPDSPSDRIWSRLFPLAAEALVVAALRAAVRPAGCCNLPSAPEPTVWTRGAYPQRPGVLRQARAFVSARVPSVFAPFLHHVRRQSRHYRRFRHRRMNNLRPVNPRAEFESPSPHQLTIFKINGLQPHPSRVPRMCQNAPLSLAGESSPAGRASKAPIRGRSL